MNDFYVDPVFEHAYAGGEGFRAARGLGLPPDGDLGQAPVVNLHMSGMRWPEFWQAVRRELERRQFSRSTLRLYRQVLRSFADSLQGQPRHSTADDVRAYLDGLVEARASWSWLSTNISVLRTALDKFGGLCVTGRLQTPRRPRRLPEILSAGETRRLLAAAPTLRDRLLLGLLYGGGLKAGEARALRWGDVDPAAQRLRVGYRRGTRERAVPIPVQLLPVLAEGARRCPAADFIFQGRRDGRALSGQMVERVVRDAARQAGIGRPVTAMTLRHTAAVHLWELGVNPREIQERLGHLRLETTLLYGRCLAPKTISPLDRLAEKAAADRLLEGLDLPPADALQMPFEDLAEPEATEETGEPADSRRPQAPAWYALLKTRLTRRFLALRNFCKARPAPLRSG